MRIVAGQYRGRKIEAPPGDTTRPTIDRVREAVFSSVASIAGPDLGGGAVLDAFAGSGALGLEALSRGCTRAVLAEDDRTALATIKGNIAALGAGASAHVLAGDVFAAAAAGRIQGGPFTLLMLDPPYRLDPVKVVGFVSDLAANDLLTDGAIAVWEHSDRVEPGWPAGFELLKRKRYGKTEVDIAVFERGV